MFVGFTEDGVAAVGAFSEVAGVGRVSDWGATNPTASFDATLQAEISVAISANDIMRLSLGIFSISSPVVSKLRVAKNR